MGEWQPIETHPNDGLPVLVFVPRKRGEPVVLQAFNPTGVQWWSIGLGAVKPSHWMPLPAPPVTQPMTDLTKMEAGNG